MPNNKTVRKRIKVTNERTIRNKSRKSAIKTFEKKFHSEVKNKNFDLAKTHLSNVSSLYDRAAKIGIIKKNHANRKKSRLALFLQKASTS